MTHVVSTRPRSRGAAEVRRLTALLNARRAAELLPLAQRLGIADHELAPMVGAAQRDVVRVRRKGGTLRQGRAHRSALDCALAALHAAAELPDPQTWLRTPRPELHGRTPLAAIRPPVSAASVAALARAAAPQPATHRRSHA